MNQLGIVDLLQLFDFDAKGSKLVRHVDKRVDIPDLHRRGWLEAYQCFQAKPVFDGLKRIASFVGGSGTSARFVGVYQVLGRRPARGGELPPGCPHTEWKDSVYYYSLKKEAGFESLENRVVIDWGKGALAWHQKTTNKPVMEILRTGSLIELFKDYLGFTLTHAELKSIVNSPGTNREWRSRLSAVSGVYLVLASGTGQQYVGSAYGSDGIWGRWSAYAGNGHGGNAQLQKLVKADAAYPASFTYSVLQILPNTTSKDEVIRWEQRHKQKLGTKATGLNSN